MNLTGRVKPRLLLGGTGINYSEKSYWINRWSPNPTQSVNVPIQDLRPNGICLLRHAQRRYCSSA